MPRRIGNTIVSRNRVAQSPLLRRGGAHQQSRTSERQGTRLQTRDEAENWREEIELNELSESEEDQDGF